MSAKSECTGRDEEKYEVTNHELRIGSREISTEQVGGITKILHYSIGHTLVTQASL